MAQRSNALLPAGGQQVFFFIRDMFGSDGFGSGRGGSGSDGFGSDRGGSGSDSSVSIPTVRLRRFRFRQSDLQIPGATRYPHTQVPGTSRYPHT